MEYYFVIILCYSNIIRCELILNEMLYMCCFRWRIDHSKPSGKIKLVLIVDVFE